MKRLANFVLKDFFANTIVNCVKLDRGCTPTPLGTYSYVIGDVRLRYRGFTQTL